MTIGQNASASKAVLLAAAVLATPASAWAGPSDTYYERAFVVAADALAGVASRAAASRTALAAVAFCPIVMRRTLRITRSGPVSDQG